MAIENYKVLKDIPEGFVVFISGVPAAGKTTISYELLRKYNEFRIIQETDLMREILRGYNDYIDFSSSKNIHTVLKKIDIYDNMKFMSYTEAALQCKHMKNSLLNIIDRQQRKGISTIINGVHIVPEVLADFASNKRIVFINLYISNEVEFNNRFEYRNESKYTQQNIKYIFETNNELHLNTLNIKSPYNSAFYSIDITSLSIEETLHEIVDCIEKRVKCTY